MILNHCFFLFSKKSSGQKKFSLSHWFEGKYAAANTQHRKLDSSGAVGRGGGHLVVGGSSSGPRCPELLPELSIVLTEYPRAGKREDAIKHTKVYSHILMSRREGDTRTEVTLISRTVS